jgi:tetratricopeptide (TPR) repeat protein
LVDEGPTDADLTESPETRREGQGSRRIVSDKLARGASVGRYLVTGELGEGGMGVVYAAYDPELDRKVALKLLQAEPAGGSSAGGQSWLLREAQALARLAHPNVIGVYDVGTLPGDRVFVAMELVEGKTLRRWLEAEHRSWREVQRVMLAAGAGLQAAHAAGLVHRDFKPENVLVGDDGRVRVMDFGLARLAGEPTASRDSDLQITSRSPLSESLTQEGAMPGTPAYMAPEIYRGSGPGAGARTDQFAFGVTLYEALFGARPFGKRELASAEPPAPKQPPPGNGVPAQLARVTMRAIAIDPDARYASMQDLLDELAVDPGAFKRRAAVGIAAVLVLGGVAAGAVVLARPSAACDVSGRMTGVWDGGVRATIADAFTKSKVPYRDAVLGSLARTIDSYVTEWSAAAVENCEAKQSKETRQLRDDCLDQRLAELRAFTQLISKPDDKMIETSANAALSLEPIKRCANVETLRAATPLTAETRPRVQPALAKLAEAKAGLIAGNLGRTINAGSEAAKLAKEIGYEPLEAEARFFVGAAMIQVGNPIDATTELSESAWAGLRSHRDDVVALAALHVALAASEGLNKDGEAQIWIALGRAAAERAGIDPHLELKLLETEGIVAGNRGDLVAARAAHEKALALAIELYGKDSMLVARDHQLLAATTARASDYIAARPNYERAHDLVLKYLGPDHPDTALMLSGMGSCYHYTGEIEKAYAAFEGALAIRERVFGKTSPVLITTLNNYAELLQGQADYPKALAMIERAQEITNATVGKAHPYYVAISSTRGDILLAMGKVADARSVLDDALAMAEKFHSPYLPEAQSSRSKLAITEQQWDLAQGLAEKAIVGLEAKAGKDANDLWKPLTNLALAKIATKHRDEAKELLQRAIMIAEKSKLPAKYLARTREALAGL